MLDPYPPSDLIALRQKVRRVGLTAQRVWRWLLAAGALLAGGGALLFHNPVPDIVQASTGLTRHLRLGTEVAPAPATGGGMEVTTAEPGDAPGEP